MFDQKKTSVSISGREITFETGKIARQAGGAVVVRCGDTMLLTTVCAAPTAAPEIDFLPLKVDYFEKFSSTGKTLGGFIKREGKQTEKEILTCRLIDRPIRPMIMDGYYNEIQILSYVISFDQENSPEPLAICAASAALAISDVPLVKPIGAVRVALIEQEFIINPTLQQMEKSRLDLLLAGTEDAILMIEGYCDFLTEDQVIEAIEEGHIAIKSICQCISDLQKLAGKEKNLSALRLMPEELLKEVEHLTSHKYKQAFEIKEKALREAAIAEIQKEVLEKLAPEDSLEKPKYPQVDIQLAMKKNSSKIMREKILTTGKRSDGRGLEDIRQIHVEMSPLPRAHGSTLFTRGETQTLAVCTLGGKNAAQRFETLTEDGLKTFYLQYSFPPFSVGEVGRIGAPGRREVGHGKLAEKSLAAIIPSQADFPYVIRLESNITESNGSSSMASVCGGCLAMMEGGVPIKKPIAGIAMGLILEDDKYAILSDILGVEDSLGDMDFKITGDAHGITAFQLDIKVEGISKDIMRVALSQARQGIVHILHKMLEVCPKPKDQLSVYAPRIETLQVKPNKIAIVIGPGGKQIRSIIEQTGVEIDIDNDGKVNIASTSFESIEKAKAMILDLTSDVEVGKTYKGKITSIVAFGLFVQIFSKEGLCHISELSNQRIDNLQDKFSVGDYIDVKVLEINDRGQIKLSHKALLPAGQRG